MCLVPLDQSKRITIRPAGVSRRRGQTSVGCEACHGCEPRTRASKSSVVKKSTSRKDLRKASMSERRDWPTAADGQASRSDAAHRRKEIHVCEAAMRDASSLETIPRAVAGNSSMPSAVVAGGGSSTSTASSATRSTTTVRSSRANACRRATCSDCHNPHSGKLRQSYAPAGQVPCGGAIRHRVRIIDHAPDFKWRLAAPRAICRRPRTWASTSATIIPCAFPAGSHSPARRRPMRATMPQQQTKAQTGRGRGQLGILRRNRRTGLRGSLRHRGDREPPAGLDRRRISPVQLRASIARASAIVSVPLKIGIGSGEP